MKSFSAALNSMRGAKNLVLCHDQADSDAVGAAYAVQCWIGGEIGVPTAVATHTHQLVEMLDIQVIENPDLSLYEHIVLVDCANSVQLGTCVPEHYWLVDHHPDNCLKEGAVDFFYENRSSTCQLVYRLFKYAKEPINRDIAIALCAGILTDTIHFHKGDAEAFQVFGELLQSAQLTYDEIQDLYGIHERDDRGAIIEAALRAKKVNLDGFHILATEIERNIPTFAARALFDLGADVSIVGYQRDSEVEIRMYLRQDLAEKYQMNADALFREVQHSPGTKIWGYQLFAGYRSTGDLQKTLENMVTVLEKRICPDPSG